MVGFCLMILMVMIMVMMMMTMIMIIGIEVMILYCRVYRHVGVRCRSTPPGVRYGTWRGNDWTNQSFLRRQNMVTVEAVESVSFSNDCFSIFHFRFKRFGSAKSVLPSYPGHADNTTFAPSCLTRCVSLYFTSPSSSCSCLFRAQYTRTQIQISKY